MSLFNVGVQTSVSPGLLKSISRRRANGGFFCIGAGGSVGIVGVSVHAGGGGGLIWGCVTVGVGALVAGVDCSGCGRVGLLLLGSGSVFGSLWQVLPVVAALGGLVRGVDGAVKGRSSVMVSRGGGLCTGRYCRRNFLLRRVILPEPSIRTTYWSYCRTSTTTPVLFHLLG